MFARQAHDQADGLRRGAEVVDTGAPITVPVGPKTLGRLFNVLGEPLDKRGDVGKEGGASIHRKPPSFEEQETQVRPCYAGLVSGVLDAREIGGHGDARQP